MSNVEFTSEEALEYVRAHCGEMIKSSLVESSHDIELQLSVEHHAVLIASGPERSARFLKDEVEGMIEQLAASLLKLSLDVSGDENLLASVAANPFEVGESFQRGGSSWTVSKVDRDEGVVELHFVHPDLYAGNDD